MIAAILAALNGLTAIPKIIDAINALQASLDKLSSQVETAAISKAQTDTQNATTTQDYKNAANETSTALRGL